MYHQATTEVAAEFNPFRPKSEPSHTLSSLPRKRHNIHFSSQATPIPSLHASCIATRPVHDRPAGSGLAWFGHTDDCRMLDLRIMRPRGLRVSAGVSTSYISAPLQKESRPMDVSTPLLWSYRVQATAPRKFNVAPRTNVLWVKFLFA